MTRQRASHDSSANVAALYARITRATAPATQIEAGVAAFTTRAVEAMRAQPGYAGCDLLVDRGSGAVVVLTFWRDAEALQTSEHALSGLRDAAAAALGVAPPDPEHYEVALQDPAGTTDAGNWVEVATLQGDAGKIDTGLAYAATSLLPALQGQAGHRATVLLVSRERGDVVGCGVWDAKEDLDAAAHALAATSAAAADAFGASNPETHSFEVAFAELVA